MAKTKDPEREEELRKIRAVGTPTAAQARAENTVKFNDFERELRSGIGKSSMSVRADQPGDGLLGTVSLNPSKPPVRAPNGQLGFSVAGTPPATLAGAQGGTVRVTGGKLPLRNPGFLGMAPTPTAKQRKSIADRVVRRRLAEGFGEGNVVPAEGYSAVRRDEGMQREANRTGEYVTRAGGPGGAIQTTVRPSYRNVEVAPAKGESPNIPQPVIQQYEGLRVRLEDAAKIQFDLNNPGRADFTGDEEVAARRKAIEAVAASELSPADKGVWDWVSTGKQPKSMKKQFKRTTVDRAVAAGWTTAKPHPMSPAARKRAGGLPMSRGGVGPGVVPQKTFATADKVLGEGGANLGTVQRHFKLYGLSSPESQKRMLASSENLRQAVALMGDKTMTPDEALVMAYKIKKPEGADPIISEVAAVKAAGKLIYGEEIMKDVVNVLGLKTGEKERTGKYNLNPWHMADADPQKAMQKTWDAFHKRLTLAGYEDDDRIAQMFSYAIEGTYFTEQEQLTDDDKLFWHNIKTKLGAPVQRGDMTAEAIEARQGAERRAAQKGTDDLVQPIPPVTPPPKEGETATEGEPDEPQQATELDGVTMPPPGGTLNDEQGMAVLKAAGGDANKARELAKQNGWVIGK